MLQKNNLLQNYFELGQPANTPQANQGKWSFFLVFSLNQKTANLLNICLLTAPYCCINDSMNQSALNGTNPIPMGMIPGGAHMPSTSFEIDTTTYYPGKFHSS